MSGLREQDENGCYARSTLPALRHFVANVRTFDLAIEFDRDLLDVRTEGTIGNTMRMADITTSARCFTADLTYFGHS